jgi:hypothetical protein
MDLEQTINELHAELEKLNQAIASLEEFERTGELPIPKAPGPQSHARRHPEMPVNSG